MRNAALLATMAAGFAASTASAQIGLVDFDGNDIGLIGYTNNQIVGNGTTNGRMSDTWTYANFASFGDAFNPMSRGSLGPFTTGGGQVGMPFGVSDDSVTAATGNSVFAGDTSGFAGAAFGRNGFFGATDTVNGTVDTGVATFTFDTTGATSLFVSIDFIAMGDFESNDVFLFEYAVDAGPFQSLFVSSVDEAGSQNYLMDSGAVVTLNDPLAINGITLDDNWRRIVGAISGVGSTLTIRFSGTTDGGSEAFGFDNIVVTPTPGALGLFGLAGLVGARRRRA
jgi:MYXO-CTERM domain-containing protein